MREEQAKKIAEDLLEFVNAYGIDEKTFAETICRGHRTLQQSVMRLFMTTIERMAVNGYDDRNAAAVMLAKKITTVAENIYLPLI